MMKLQNLAIVMCIFVGSCKNYSDKKGTYRVSTDKTMEVYYLEDNLVLLSMRDATFGLIAKAVSRGAPEYRSSTGDEIQDVLVDQIKSLGNDFGKTVFFGEQFGRGDDVTYFLIKDKKASFFNSKQKLLENLPAKVASDGMNFLPMQEYMNNVRKVNPL